MYQFRTFGKRVSGPIGTGPDTPVKVIGGLEQDIRQLYLTILRLDRIDGGRSVDVIYRGGAGQLGVSRVKDTCEDLGIEWPAGWMEAMARAAGKESPEDSAQRRGTGQTEGSRRWFEGNGHQTPKGSGAGQGTTLHAPTQREAAGSSGPNEVRVSMGLFDPEGLEARVSRAASTIGGFVEALYTFHQTGLPPEPQKVAVRMLSLGLLTDKKRLRDAIACVQKGASPRE